ncbi:replication initiator protein A [Herbaspirillum sp. RTI4]|uniref:replication initiator protein A n=1 Tax=Herbaspirillum sp. RTI4 TaxID=3048640 RepID=UPI002AB36850|nr:replication initiator protein A [Herbaspirillum sp. RTI4]MDY7580135.1 replication initiator protein A [Herbaspirillum sp. RTI4]MEA9983262.1 replication initiator protein A [Herbaspirillum sp. RTI4]
MKSTKTLNDAINSLHASRQAKAAERLDQQQPELFDSGSDTPLSPDELAAMVSVIDAPSPLGSADVKIEVASAKRGRSKLLPVRHIERDFFLCDMFDYAMKDDGASMEAPIFTLATQPDLSVWHWESKDGNRSVTVTPSVQGRATQFDKDVLIFVVSQMTEALNSSRQDAKNRTVRFVVYDYLVSTNKPTGGKEYQRLETTFERLRGTSIKTDIKTGGQRVKQGFGIIDSWSIIEKSPDDERMIAVEVTLSKWLFNAVQAHEVLTIHRDYFRLRKPLERRLYEIVRKHCGQQALWVIGLELLREKCGAHSHIRAFRSQVVGIIKADTLPEYRMFYDRAKDQVTFYVKNPKKLAVALAGGQRERSA